MAGVRTYSDLEVAVRCDTSDEGEGPVFDARTGRLVWVDIYGGRVFEDDLVDGRQTVTEVGTMVGAVAEGFGFLTDGELRVVDRVLPEPNLRMNDGKADSRGRFWAGSNDMDFAPGQGRLYRGDFQADFGELDRLAVLTTTDGAGVPDGLAVDVGGCFWVAMRGGREVRRYDPAGRVVGVVPVPVLQPSSCVFGPDGRLFITSARHGLCAEELERSPLFGSVFVVETGTTGVPVQPFGA